MNLTQAIKEQAHRLGFSMVGVTSSDPLPHAEVFKAWLREGRQGEMTYMSTPRSRECRANPTKILSECRSVLVLGMHYPAPPRLDSEQPDTTFPLGIVAAYAWGKDYHTVLAERLKSLVRFIESQVGHPIPNRWYTDTGPLLERELGQRAGLGWIGKNTCLINPDSGSYFFLGEVLLGIELEPDLPFTPDRCGSCRRCLAACPTGCILPDRTLDARRCISYLTIELKGSIPLEQRPMLGTHVFGCDICQQVCPWNRFATHAADPVFTMRQTQPTVNLPAEMALSAAEFNFKYRNSPIKRAKRRGFLRNVSIALGNLGDRRAMDSLTGGLAHEDSLVRLHSAWALGRIGRNLAGEVLNRALLIEPDPGVRLEIQNALAQDEHIWRANVR